MAAIARTDAIANVAFRTPVEHAEDALHQFAVVLESVYAQVFSARVLGEHGVELPPGSETRTRSDAGSVPSTMFSARSGVVGEDLLRTLEGLVLVEVGHRGDTGLVLQAPPPQLRAGVRLALRVPFGDFGIEVELHLHPVEEDLLALVGHLDHQQTATEHAQRDRRGDDHRDGHGRVAAQSVENLADDEIRSHACSDVLGGGRCCVSGVG